jgi:uncharacterized protein (DUF362 family)
MAKVSRKMKVSLIFISGIVLAGVIYFYQKIFGGKVQSLPENEFVVGEANNLTVSPETKKEEIVAVTYAESPAKGVAEVIKKTGNLDFIKPGQKVLVKPNVNSDDKAPGTTHPESLAEVIRQVKTKGAYVIVGDRSNPRYGTIASMKKTGMYKAAEGAGADEIVSFEDEEWVRVNPEKAKNWPKGFRIPKRLAEIDHIISVPVLHTHSITGHSLAIKNMVGLIHTSDRMLFHSSTKLQEMISEISLAIRPSLTIIEGAKSFIDGGPSHGTLVEPKVYLASKDILAADVVGVGLLTKHGANFSYESPWESKQIKHFVTLNLFQYSKKEIEKEIGKI